MKSQNIHRDLDTSFVNLSALIKYLRRRRFVGSIKVELKSYIANIEFTKENRLKVHERDELTGGIFEGEEALQRILIRTRKPGGNINVYQLLEEIRAVPTSNAQVRNTVRKPKIRTEPRADLGTGSARPIKTPSNLNDLDVRAPNIPASRNGILDARNKPPKSQTPGFRALAEEPVPIKSADNQKNSLPDFPFSLSNKFEDKARKALSSPQDWQTILNLIVELLRVTDRSLAMADIDFDAAFRKVRTEISGDYPFLDPSSDEFDYIDGKIRLTKQMNAKIFIAGIMESLRRIFEKLASYPKYEEVRRATLERIDRLAKKRSGFYDKFSITPQINKILSSSPYKSG